MASSGPREDARTPPRAGPGEEGRERAAFGAAVAAILFLAFSLRLTGLAPPSLFLDDTWVALLARDASLAHLLALKPHHPPGFFLLVALARRLGPGAEFPVQLLPFAASLALVPLGASLVRRRTGSLGGGILAAALLAVNPLLSSLSVRVKPYATDALLSLLLAALAERCIAEPSVLRLRLLCLFAPLAVLFSYPAALVGAVGFAVALGAALSATRTRRPLFGLAAGFLAAEGLLGLLVIRGQANAALTRYWTEGFAPLGDPRETFAFVASRSALLLGGSFPDGWEALGIFVPLALVVLAFRRETRWAAAFVAALWASLFAVSAMRFYPIDARTSAFVYPLVALAAAGTIAAQTRRARAPLVREGVPAFLAAAVVVSSARPVAYPPYDDARLVRTLAARARPGDAVLLFPPANFSAAYYSGWPARLIPSDNYGTRFEAQLERPRSLILPALPGWADRPGVLDPALREFISWRPGTVFYLATNLDAGGLLAHTHIQELLASCGYMAERVDVARSAELLRFSRQPSRPRP